MSILSKMKQYITRVNKTYVSGKKNKYIVIHYTGNNTDTAENNAKYFRNENRHASAHYFVDDNNIYQVVPDNYAAWAVGVNYGTNNLFGTVTNKNSLSIEMCSKNGKITDKTFKNTVELTKYLMKKYGISASRVYRHYDVCSKECPGWNGWLPGNSKYWKKFRSEIGGSSSGSTSSYFKVKIKVDDLQIRKGPGTNYASVGHVDAGDVYTIVDVSSDGWGKLKSGAGWIKITDKYVKRV